MNRRKFIASTSLLGIGSAVMAFPQENQLIKPPALKKGGTVGLVTPASSLTRSAFEKTLANIETLGFKVKYSDNLRVTRGFLSGTDAQRLTDLHEMFENGEVDAIICARGGYGSARLLPNLQADLIKRNAKPLVGYSDITALHQFIYAKTGLVTFHGPVGASDYNDFTRDYMEDLVMKGKKIKIQADEPQVIVPGEAEGQLVGGNLSLLASLVGTPYQMTYEGHILFIEEIGESTYRVDRMLTQLVQSGALKGVKGIALGYFTNCDAKPGDRGYEQSISLMEVFKDQFEDLGVPVLAGLPFGHEEHNATLPVGVRAKLDTSKGSIKTLEAAVK
ncbi:MAG: LD-carboxypeptidase [Cytophagales bacterium]|nr:LD-carboxypeptidase [Cytophagales bacterium]